MEPPVIAAYKRSPFTQAIKGELADVRPDALIADVMRAVADGAGIPPGEIEDVLLGCAFPEGEQGLNVARIAVFLAGLPECVAGATVNRFCGSSMQAIHIAAGNIAMGAGHAYLAGGVESMSRVPMGGFSPMPHPELYERRPDVYESMGITAENLAGQYKISRSEQEDFALESHRKASSEAARAAFAAEIVAIKREDGGLVATDGCVRPNASKKDMEGLRPAFDAKGTVTAATSSPLTDGASCTLICSASFAKSRGLPVLAKIRSVAVSGCAPAIMGIGPVEASRKALKRAGISLADVDIVELNEAFAAQALAVVRELGIDAAKLNLHGGALALGHPLGASGARITGKAASLLAASGKRFALATMCVGGGQGIATVLEAWE
jgi:acetyl-CoA acyltransferase